MASLNALTGIDGIWTLVTSVSGTYIRGVLMPLRALMGFGLQTGATRCHTLHQLVLMPLRALMGFGLSSFNYLPPGAGQS